jgi:ribosomal protein S18 acetylase RimI-like enzyme
VALNPNSLHTIDRFWGHDLGLDSEALPAISGIICTVQHNYSGIQLFRRGSTLIVAIPPGISDFVRQAVQARPPDDAFSAQWLQSVLGSRAQVIVGPAEVNYADVTMFRIVHHGSARPLSEEDAGSYRALISSLSETEIADSGASAGKYPAFGSFFDNVLCSVASYEVWQSSIAHITVATHPQYRRRGFGTAAVEALAVDAFERGLILQWRAVAWNTNSLALAADLGFEHYCSTMFVRLKP